MDRSIGRDSSRGWFRGRIRVPYIQTGSSTSRLRQFDVERFCFAALQVEQIDLATDQVPTPRLSPLQKSCSSAVSRDPEIRRITIPIRELLDGARSDSHSVNIIIVAVLPVARSHEKHAPVWYEVWVGDDRVLVVCFFRNMGLKSQGGRPRFN